MGITVPKVQKVVEPSSVTPPNKDVAKKLGKRDVSYLQTEKTNNPGNKSLKEIAFDKVIKYAHEFLLDGNRIEEGIAGIDWINECLKARNEASNFKPLIELSKNESIWFGKAFPRGFQKALTIGYMYEKGIHAFNKGKFNYKEFKDWLSQNGFKEIANNLNENYFKHITVTLDEKKNPTVYFGIKEYKNVMEGLKDEVLTEQRKKKAAITVQKAFRTFSKRLYDKEANPYGYKEMTYTPSPGKPDHGRQYYIKGAKKSEGIKTQVLYHPKTGANPKNKGAFKEVAGLDKRFIALSSTNSREQISGSSKEVLEIIEGLKSFQPNFLVKNNLLISRNRGANLGRYRGKALLKLNNFKEILEDVSKLHAKGYYHRDIKPENMVRNDDGKIYLIDLDTLTPQEHSLDIAGTGSYLTKKLCQNLFPKLSKEKGLGSIENPSNEYSQVADEYALLLSIMELTSGFNIRYNNAAPSTKNADGIDIDKEEVMYWIWQNVKKENIERIKLLLKNPIKYHDTYKDEPKPLLQLLKF